jgi:hypothetical protein
MNPLSFADIDRYAIMIGYTGVEDRLFFSEVISECDRLFLEDAQKKQDAKSKQDKSLSKSRK